MAWSLKLEEEALAMVGESSAPMRCRSGEAKRWKGKKEREVSFWRSAALLPPNLS